jgi:ubiquinone/menaquinone biosynthesis C-methylase UbiE
VTDYRSPREVLTQATTFKGRRVADIGCGEGALARFLASQGADQVIGVECGTAMLEHARAGEAMDNLRFVSGVGEALPLPDQSVDVIVYSNSLHHVPPEAQFDALEEAYRVLVENGELLVLEPIARGPTQTLMAPVHDETEVRAHAQAQLDAIVSKGRFNRIASFEFTKVVEHADFEAFRDRMLRINPHRAPEVDALGESWRKIFESAGHQTETGWRFDQPIAFAHLRKV